MKLKSELNETGVFWLQRRLCPVLERLGKEVTLLFTPDSLTFVQDANTTQGIRVHAIFKQDVLFHIYGCKSQNDDKICIKVNTTMLVRVLKSIEEGFERVEMRLVKRRVAEQGNKQLPFLNFNTTSSNLDIVMDLPIIGKPLQPSDLKQVEETLPQFDNVANAPAYYLDVQPLVVAQLPQMVDRLKHINEVIQIATTQAGDFHLQAQTVSVTLGTEHRGLKVLPHDQAHVRPADGDPKDSTGRLHAALRRGEAHQVSVRARDLARSLLCHNTKPDRVLCGISQNKGFVQLGLQYRKPTSDRIDPGVVMYIKLPVQVEM